MIEDLWLCKIIIKDGHLQLFGSRVEYNTIVGLHASMDTLYFWYKVGWKGKSDPTYLIKDGSCLA